MTNPFSPPRSDPQAPGRSSTNRRLVAFLGIGEIIFGAAFGLLSVAGAYYARSSQDLNWQRFVRVELFTVSASVICVLAGLSLLRGPSSRALLLQLGPVIALVVSVWYRWS